MSKAATQPLEGELIESPDKKKSGEGELVPEPPRVGPLATLPQIRTEMAVIYRAARRGEIESQEGSRLLYMLDRLFDAEHANIKLTLIERQRAEDGMPVFTGFDVKLLASDDK